MLGCDGSQQSLMIRYVMRYQDHVASRFRRSITSIRSQCSQSNPRHAHVAHGKELFFSGRRQIHSFSVRHLEKTANRCNPAKSLSYVRLVLPLQGIVSTCAMVDNRFASASASAAYDAASGSASSDVPERVLREPLGWAVEGNICSGKTTLCREIAAVVEKEDREANETDGPRREVLIAYEPIAEDALALFYSDVKKYAFWFQTYMLALRLNEAQSIPMRDSIADSKNGNVKISLLDRSLLGDYAFAIRQYLDGNISEHELRAYHGIRQERGFSDPTATSSTSSASVASQIQKNGRQDIVDGESDSQKSSNQKGRHERQVGLSLLYIDVDPQICHNRIMNRGTKSEMTLPLKYLEDLDAVYINLLLKFLSDSDQDAIVVVDSDNNEELKWLLIDLILGKRSYAERRRQFPRRSRVSFVNLRDQGIEDIKNFKIEDFMRETVMKGGTYSNMRTVTYDTMDDVLNCMARRDSMNDIAENCDNFAKDSNFTTVALRWGCWCNDKTRHVAFPDKGNDFSAHPPRVVRYVLMKHLSLGHDVILYQ